MDGRSGQLEGAIGSGHSWREDSSWDVGQVVPTPRRWAYPKLVARSAVSLLLAHHIADKNRRTAAPGTVELPASLARDGPSASRPFGTKTWLIGQAD
jgi:hypothetical protein